MGVNAVRRASHPWILIPKHQEGTGVSLPVGEGIWKSKKNPRPSFLPQADKPRASKVALTESIMNFYLGEKLQLYCST